MTKPAFSIAAMANSMLAGTWGTHTSIERTCIDQLERSHGAMTSGYYRVPAYALTRDLTVASASGGGYLVGQSNLEYLPALQPASVALRLGAQMLPAAAGGAAVPRGVTAASTTWLANETQSITETAPVLGQVIGSPKLLACFFEVSRLLLMQSNADAVIQLEAQRAAGAALDAAILQGTGASGQPTGITNTAGIGAFTGASLNQAALRNAQADVAAANAIVAGARGYVTTPTIAETLTTRQRFTGSDRALWENALDDGQVEGVRALATGNCPSGTMIYGDWSSCYVLEWAGGVGIALDPFLKFTSGVVGVRLLLPVDVIIARAASFSVATSVT
jgi:HK97 family phage major capsid protein